MKYYLVILVFALSIAIAVNETVAADRAIRVVGSGSGSRVALVIGNADYSNVPALTNPANDAMDMAEALEDLGFEVIHARNLDHRTMEESVREFTGRLRGGEVGLFYYAGHGVQVNGRNYLIPVDADIRRTTDVKFESLDAEWVLAEMEAAGNPLNIVVLDACRNNPFPGSSRSGTRGLATMNAPSGSLIAYATAPGSIADDGDGRNGLYTQQLLRQMRVPGVQVEDVFKRVRVAVMEESSGDQIPWEASSLTGEFYFNGPTSGETPQQEVAQASKSLSGFAGSERAITGPSLAVFCPEVDDVPGLEASPALAALCPVAAAENGLYGGLMDYQPSLPWLMLLTTMRNLEALESGETASPSAADVLELLNQYGYCHEQDWRFEGTVPPILNEWSRGNVRELRRLADNDASALRSFEETFGLPLSEARHQFLERGPAYIKPGQLNPKNNFQERLNWKTFEHLGYIDQRSQSRAHYNYAYVIESQAKYSWGRTLNKMFKRLASGPTNPDPNLNHTPVDPTIVDHEHFFRFATCGLLAHGKVQQLYGLRKVECGVQSTRDINRALAMAQSGTPLYVTPLDSAEQGGWLASFENGKVIVQDVVNRELRALTSGMQEATTWDCASYDEPSEHVGDIYRY